MTDSPPESTEPPSAPPDGSPRASAGKPLSIDWSLAAVWDRLKHHKVVQWTLAYLAVAYTLLHGAEMLGGSLGWPHGLLRVFTLILILLVPVVITLAWYHGARGQQRASGTEIMIIAILLAIGGAFLWRDSTARPWRRTGDRGHTRRGGQRSVAPRRQRPSCRPARSQTRSPCCPSPTCPRSRITNTCPMASRTRS